MMPIALVIIATPAVLLLAAVGVGITDDALD